MKNKVALVTGAASGLGCAVARRFAVAGASVCLADIDQAGLDEAKTAMAGLGVNVVTHCVDLASPDACCETVAFTRDSLGRVDALCNAAAVMQPGHSADTTASVFNKTLAVNLAAPFFLMQAALPELLKNKGAVVNIASAVGITAQAYNAAYCASKAGLIHLTKSLAMEYMHEPVRINAIAPGGMMTPLARNMMQVNEPNAALMGRTSPLRGLVDIEEVAEMAVYLASDAAQGYHGSCIVIDKGMSAG